ncbi:CGNR zinc finger domain-containing protein [Mesorhizobium sp. INR15]|uniref:CGNR zinc finger domain-containing protein n=1 Tax=Mesorhizobium sp. INR15 TaxID=2654248 RepID=UPI0018964526|nr:CGNR zinc finger domain-containing protein [Mesorhizobium sp. INR15]
MHPSKSELLRDPPSRADSLDLIGSELALDFTNTSSGRGTPTHQDHLRCFNDVIHWIEHAKVVSSFDCAFIVSTVPERSKGATAIFRKTLETREMIWAVASALAEKREVPDDMRAALVATHSESLAFARMGRHDNSYIWTWDPRRNVQASILGPITLSALTLLMEKDLTRTKRCEGKDCGWLFFDRTKNGARRWCEMRVCGNRSKVRAARGRRKLSAQGQG